MPKSNGKLRRLSGGAEGKSPYARRLPTYDVCTGRVVSGMSSRIRVSDPDGAPISAFDSEAYIDSVYRSRHPREFASIQKLLKSELLDEGGMDAFLTSREFGHVNMATMQPTTTSEPGYGASQRGVVFPPHGYSLETTAHARRSAEVRRGSWSTVPDDWYAVTAINLNQGLRVGGVTETVGDWVIVAVRLPQSGGTEVQIVSPKDRARDVQRVASSPDFSRFWELLRGRKPEARDYEAMVFNQNASALWCPPPPSPVPSDTGLYAAYLLWNMVVMLPPGQRDYSPEEFTKKKRRRFARKVAAFIYRNSVINGPE